MAPTVDRVFEYGRHFKLDEPFKIRLGKGETVLLPLEPIRELLFPSTAALLASDETGQQAPGAATQPLAIGLELSNCEGTLQSFIVLKNDRARSFSTASYQCVTLTEASEAQQQQANLCPLYDPEFPVAMRVDPAQVKGFILRADVGSAVESIALLRSTKAAGGFEKAFVVASADDQPRQTPFNVTFSYAETTLGFEAPFVWAHGAADASLTGSSVCESCEYFLYAEKITPNRTALLSSDVRAELPYCMRERSSVRYQLPKPSSDANADAHHRHVKVDDLFADQFKASGEYRFVLMASLPSTSNHHHPAMLAYAPQQLVVTVPPFYRSHFFVAFVIVALVALAAILHVQYQPHRRFFPKLKTRSPSDAEDDAEFVSLLARSVSANALSRVDAMDSLEEGLLQEHDDDDGNGDAVDGQEAAEYSGGRSSLLDAIKRTKEQPSAHLEGYHEIK
ncbi:hypothetical protein PybrP1_008723 [[Pythium] brassicae (nom. inval.)]|nr:hypothetical protein PybrP1_008723 [[Pythium] brassicae (nom. inval.)]